MLVPFYSIASFFRCPALFYLIPALLFAGSMTEAFLRDNIRPLLRRMAQNARPYPTLDAAVAALRARDIPAVVAPSLNLRSVALTAPCEVTMADLPLSLDFFPFYTPYYYANETEAAEAADASDDPELELQQRDWAIALQKGQSSTVATAALRFCSCSC